VRYYNYLPNLFLNENLDTLYFKYTHDEKSTTHYFFFKLCFNCYLNFKVPTEKLALKSKNKRNVRKLQEYTTKSKNIGSKSVTSTIANKFISRTKQQIPSVKPTVSTMKNTRMVKQMTVSVNDLVIVIKNIDTKNMIVLTFHARNIRFKF